MFRPLNNINKRGSWQIVLKRDPKGVIEYDDAKIAQEAVRQFKKWIKESIEEQKNRDKTARNMPLVDATVDFTPIQGLTPEENRDLNGISNPPESVDKSTRPEFLKKTDYVQDIIDKTKEEADNLIKEKNIKNAE